MEGLDISRIASTVSAAPGEYPKVSRINLTRFIRTATAVLIINSIIHAQIMTPLQAMPEYSRSPAPSPTTMWHAENETNWTIDYTEYLHKNAMHGMLEIGDLVELKEVAGTQPDRWYAYADSFGLLVTLVANLIN
jgi:hypothetical protein